MTTKYETRGTSKQLDIRPTMWMEHSEYTIAEKIETLHPVTTTFQTYDH